MRTLTILKGVAALALLTSFGAANAAHLPSPCGAGENGAGTNCMYLTTSGNVYDGVSGNRTASTGLSFDIGVWIDFGAEAIQGGAFDILFATAGVSSYSWNWNTSGTDGDFTGEMSLNGSATANGYEGIQFDDTSMPFATSGYGDGRNQSGFQLVGTLSVVMSGDASVLFSISNSQYASNTFPNCFSGDGGASCALTDFYTLDVNASAVPLPAAVWMMLAGIGSLGSFARRRS